MTLKILYASFQLGSVLPGYVRYALSKLAKCGSVTLITNRRELAPQELAFLEAAGIGLFMTENRGFDFGMWRRYLASVEWNLGEDFRLVLVNDSMVYYRDRFGEFFERAEALGASAVSLTENFEVAHHLQSFFLYLRPEAVGALKRHFAATPEQEDFRGAVRNHEIAFSAQLLAEGLKIEALFKTRKPILFSYVELIASGAGFVKRKLLQRRFPIADVCHFWINLEPGALYADYAKIIAEKGSLDPDFKLEWLPQKSVGALHDALGFLCGILAFFQGGLLLLRRKIAKARGRL